MNKPHATSILIVDDERANVESLSRILEREKFTVFQAGDGREGLDLMRQHAVDLVITDMMMPRMDGLDLLKAVKAISPGTEVIMITAYGSIERAVEVMKHGAYDYIIKPLKRREILKVVEKALEKANLLQENLELREHIKELKQQTKSRQHPPLISGKSTAMHRTLSMLKQAAPTTATVCIQGETGTGKELLARELHRLSERAEQAFIAINCGGIPESLIESELFGHEKGAFTSAHSSKPGKLELADGGTLFLDEIGELSMPVQVKLLRVLQERVIERLGSTKPIPIDIRLVTATHRDLQEEIQEGRFREDLYYRLNVIELHVPPLRERPEDIPLLAQHFLDRYCQEYKKPALAIAPETMEILQNYSWPGNVRQLENAMANVVVFAPGPQLLPHDLPPNIHQSKTEGNYFVIPFGTPLDEIERHVIHETLRRTNDKKLAAQLLGIATRTIYRKLESIQNDETDKEKTSTDKG